MILESLKKLQNGNDIRGVAMEGVKGENVNLTPETVRKLASSFCLWLSKKTGVPLNELKVSVGNDSRLTAPSLMEGLISGITVLGSTAINFKLASTPAMFMSTTLKGYEYNGAIMLTASHLSFNRNGLKFFTPAGGLEKQDITELLEIASSTSLPFAKVPGKECSVDFISVYSQYLLEKIRMGANDPDDYMKPLKGLHIIVDAGNGSGGFFVDKVLIPLGADTTGSQFLEPDGAFPNHIPNPEDKDAMQSIRRAVMDLHADFGIIFDTDVDRAGAVDKKGNPINRNRIIALMSSIILSEHPGSVIVTDSITSDELTTFIEEKLHGIHHRYKRGYKNVINEAKRLNGIGRECHLAIETSGHGALKENHFLDDGAYMIAKILIEISKLKRQNRTIDELLQDLEDPEESVEFRLSILTPDFKTYGNAVIDDMMSFVQTSDGCQIAPENYEGIRVSFDKDHGDGWCLLRLSLHDPLMPLNVESREPGGTKLIVSEILSFIKEYNNLDVQPINQYVGV